MGFTLLGILNAQAVGAAGGAVAGYILGGNTGDNIGETTVDKFSFADDTRTTLGTGLSRGVRGFAGMSNVSVAGYTGGGAPGRTTTVEKFTFPDDTRTVLGTGLSAANNSNMGFANTGTAGFFAGGDAVGATNFVDKFSFPSDSRSAATTMPSGRRLSSGFEQTNVAGYLAGGINAATGSDTSEVIKLTFSSETWSSLASGLSSARRVTGSFHNGTVAAYTAGGGSGSNIARSTTVDKFTFPAETRTTLGTGLSTSAATPTGFANNGVAGYIALGYTGSATATVDKFSFTDDTRSTLGTGLSQARFNSAGFENGS